MVFFSTTPIAPEPAPLYSTFFPSREGTQSLVSTNPSIARRLDVPRTGEFKREMMTWRTPHLGYVQMYINPQNMRIEDRKQITAERTKGGFVIQYAGEELTRISIDGTTGSGGIEGINILRSIYRSEQEGFESVALSLEEQLANTQLNTLAANLLDQSPLSEINLFAIANDTLRAFGRPQPTLASLAANVELFFQGELWRGYFENFTVTENTNNLGWFDYSFVFVAYAKQGIRRNFMPWHRQPINPAGVSNNPLSFVDVNENINPFTNPPDGITNPDNPRGEPSSANIADAIGSIVNTANRVVRTATGGSGLNITGTSL